MFACRYACTLSLWEHDDLWQYYIASYIHPTWWYIDMILWTLVFKAGFVRVNFPCILVLTHINVSYNITLHFSALRKPWVSCFLSEELMGSVSLTVMGKVGQSCWQPPSVSSRTPPLRYHSRNFCFFRRSIWFMLLINAEEVEMQKHVLGDWTLSLFKCLCLYM